MLSRYSVLVFVAFSCVLFSCSPERPVGQQAAGTDSGKTKAKDTAAAVPQHPAISYHFEYKAQWKRKDTFEGYQHKEILAAINRVDERHLQRLDSFLVPDHYIDTVAVYMPFPAYSAQLKDIRKIILFSYPAQAFAAYEQGKLILTGPTNMGKKASPTPQGLFFCNWKSKETRSTVNDEWILKWNFNVSNRGGVGFHQYDLPGYPASHSCMRLWAAQAEFLYGWAEQWKLSKDDKLLAKGTPVIVYGTYPFGQPRPWFVLAANGHALDISDSLIGAMVQPHMETILAAQVGRDSVLTAQQAAMTVVGN
jgi:hypothetical protein